MLPSPQPSIMELFGCRRMQRVNCLPIEAPLVRIYKRWGFCIFVKSSNFIVYASICRTSLSNILLSWNEPFGSFER